MYIHTYIHTSVLTSGTMIFASTMDLTNWNATFWKLDATSIILAVNKPRRDLQR